MKTPKLFATIFRDKNGRIVVAEWPNAPLVAFIVFWALSLALHGRFKTVSNDLAELSLVVWSIWEIIKGHSLFRRLLGGAVLIGTVMGVASKLIR